MSDKRSNFGSFLAGAIVGGLIGAGVAILKAPQSGDQTRYRIRAAAEQFQNRAQEAIESAREHGQVAVSKISDHAQVISQEAKQAVDVALDEGKAVVNETKRIAREGFKEAKANIEIEAVDDALQE